jgi:NTP pyrophosphatase (non-canonical NTP hydrolase)
MNTTHITLEQLQEEVSEWSHRNFPNNKPYHPLLGLVEEHGELHDAGNSIEVEDAIADAVIYLADYCARNGIKLRDSGEEPKNGLRWLCHYHLKGEQGIRYKPDEIPALKQRCSDQIVSNLKRQADYSGICFADAITRTWNKVKQRDWQKNPINAASASLA